MSDIETLCSTIVNRPDNKTIGVLVDILNQQENLDYEMILRRCGKYFNGINLESCFENICRKNTIYLIKIYLESIDDISEKQLIQSVNYSFDYLELLLNKRYDYWSLMNAMKIYLNPSKSVELAEELVRFLVDFHSASSSTIDWLCALIDAHFSSFVLAKWNKLSLVERFVQDRLTTFDQLQGLNTIKKSNTIHKKPTNNLYTLQRIHFK